MAMKRLIQKTTETCDQKYDDSKNVESKYTT
ncbi:hypothetical protein CoNPh26_CDS0062 [Staphylococcus phage S-CoN_Ph26]|nr:hypothetical protein CoNPh26_CDS0062 [Staphylococcus phage S-CoN_Ph26]